MDPTRNRLVIKPAHGELNDSSRSALEILKEGQNGYQTGVRVNHVSSGVNCMVAIVYQKFTTLRGFSDQTVDHTCFK